MEDKKDTVLSGQETDLQPVQPEDGARDGENRSQTPDPVTPLNNGGKRSFDIDYYAKKKEDLYDKLPFTLKQLDIIIAVLVVLFVVAFIVGAMKGKGVI